MLAAFRHDTVLALANAGSDLALNAFINNLPLTPVPPPLPPGVAPPLTTTPLCDA